MAVSNYTEKLKDPRWQKKRLQIMERDDWTCQKCFDRKSTLVVHHRRYLSATDPWDYPDETLVTLCEDCHEVETANYTEATDLLSMVRDKFFSNEIYALANGFHQLEFWTTSGVVASVYEWVLSDPNIQRELTKRYFAKIAKQQKRGAVNNLTKEAP